MPLYDFRCDRNHEFEKIVTSYNQEQTVPCPYCLGKAHIVLLPGSRSGVVFHMNYMAED